MPRSRLASRPPPPTSPRSTRRPPWSPRRSPRAAPQLLVLLALLVEVLHPARRAVLLVELAQRPPLSPTAVRVEAGEVRVSRFVALLAFLDEHQTPTALRRRRRRRAWPAEDAGTRGAVCLNSIIALADVRGRKRRLRAERRAAAGRVAISGSGSPGPVSRTRFHLSSVRSNRGPSSDRAKNPHPAECLLEIRALVEPQNSARGKISRKGVERGHHVASSDEFSRFFARAPIGRADGSMTQAREKKRIQPEK